MTDIDLVIKIPEEVYKKIKETCMLISGNRGSARRFDYILFKAVNNGTPLPKGHGKLKDEDEIVKAIEDRVEFLRKNDETFMCLRKDIDILGCIPKIRYEVPTIIEADTTEKEEE